MLLYKVKQNDEKKNCLHYKIPIEEKKTLQQKKVDVRM